MGCTGCLKKITRVGSWPAMTFENTATKSKVMAGHDPTHFGTKNLLLESKGVGEVKLTGRFQLEAPRRFL
jgi:hypothetical protein